MRKEEFENRIHDLLPGMSKAAMENFFSYANELEINGIEQSESFYNRLYVEFFLVKRDHGEDIARTLFDMEERFAFNPFELRGAARLMVQGWPPEQIMEYVEKNGCTPTLEEAIESRAFLSTFQEMEVTPGSDFSDSSFEGFEPKMR